MKPRLAIVAVVAILSCPLLATACGARSDGLLPPEPGATGTPNPTPTATSTANVPPDSGPVAAPFPSGTIAVAASGGGVTFYPAGATTNAALSHLDWAPATYDLQSLAFGPSGELYVAALSDSGTLPARVDVFAPGSVGGAAPIRTITGAATTVTICAGLAVDSHGYLYVANDGATVSSPSAVEVFAPGASGNVSPVRLITPASSDVVFWVPGGLALDASGDLYVASKEGSSVDELAPGAGEDATPIEIVGDTNDLHTPMGVAVGPGGQIYVLDASTSTSVVIFGADGSGPIGVIQGDAAQFSNVTDIAVDAAGRVYVADGAPGISVFAAGATGNVAPVVLLEGMETVAIAP